MPSTRELVRSIAIAEPHLNQTEIAARVGVSRERVRQIVTQERLTIASGVRGSAPRVGRPKQPPQSRVITGGVPVRINHTVAGTIGELLAAADLMARGLMVFFPLVRTGHCDLVSLDERTGKVERIEVRTGRRSGEHVKYGRPDRSRSDRRAIVMTGEPVMYEPRMPGDPRPQTP